MKLERNWNEIGTKLERNWNEIGMKFNVLCPICSGCPSAGALHSFTFWSRTSESVCIAKCTPWPHECCLLHSWSAVLIRFPMQAMEEVRKIKPKRTLFTGMAASASPFASMHTNCMARNKPLCCYFNIHALSLKFEFYITIVLCFSNFMINTYA